MNEILERVTVRLPENEAEFATLIAKEAEVFGDAEAFYDDLYIEIGKKNTLAAFIDGKMAGAVNFPEITYPTNEKTFIGGYIFAAWVAPEPRVKTGYLARYAKLVSSADKGAVLA